jgi:hypothetical protein
MLLNLSVRSIYDHNHEWMSIAKSKLFRANTHLSLSELSYLSDVRQPEARSESRLSNRHLKGYSSLSISVLKPPHGGHNLCSTNRFAPAQTASAAPTPPDGPVQSQQFERHCQGSGEVSQVHRGRGLTFHQKYESACQWAAGTCKIRVRSRHDTSQIATSHRGCGCFACHLHTLPAGAWQLAVVWPAFSDS